MGLRLLFGLVKGLLLGGLLGFGLANIGLAAPAAWAAYPAAAVVGILIGLIAGKPIWAEGARIEAGLKATIGALLGLLLMWLARSFLTIGVPFDLGQLAAANSSLLESAKAGTIGGLSITSLPLIAAALGAFYDADNTPGDEAAPPGNKRIATTPGKARIAADEFDDEFGAEEAEQGRKAKR